ncbi:MAG: histidine phosphatase family protein [Treponema sp.]
MKTAILIRHSKRTEFTDVRNHGSAFLTEEGIFIAENYGAELASQGLKKIKCFSSPVKRCIQTCNAIKKNFTNSGEVKLSDVLGEPGPFVYGDAIESFEKLGTVGVIQELLAGKNLPFIRSAGEGSKILMDFIRENTVDNDEQTVSLFVSHDAIVIPLLNFLLGESFDEDHWIEYIGGIKIDFDENKMFVQRVIGIK